MVGIAVMSVAGCGCSPTDLFSVASVVMLVLRNSPSELNRLVKERVDGVRDVGVSVGGPVVAWYAGG